MTEWDGDVSADKPQAVFFNATHTCHRLKILIDLKGGGATWDTAPIETQPEKISTTNILPSGRSVLYADVNKGYKLLIKVSAPEYVVRWKLAESKEYECPPEA